MKLQVEITRQDFSDFMMHHFVQNRLGKTVAIGLACLIGLLYFSNKDKPDFDFGINLITAAVYCVIYAALIYFPLRNTRKIPAENGAFLGVKEYDFTEHEILCADKDASGRYNWSAVKKLTESKKAFYLYVDNNMAFVIPKRALHNEAGVEAFRAYVKERTGLN
ncbi:YcxB family protein [Paracnuella aquatica]|uniref:YcxB family protein n=1 Tax=Paracnuella aquatica TaxID=2268757 RepID=UPI000DEFFDB2|nr:YcxB family protein [Paracnuella aquatica]RPD45101.1 YcxB family protein [Paracnuella aquatica]